MERKWFFRIGSSTRGPFTAAQMLHFIKAGQVDSRTLVRQGRGGRWIAAGQATDLHKYTTAAPPLPAVDNRTLVDAIMTWLRSDDTSKNVGWSLAGAVLLIFVMVVLLSRSDEDGTAPIESGLGPLSVASEGNDEREPLPPSVHLTESPTVTPLATSGNADTSTSSTHNQATSPNSGTLALSTEEVVANTEPSIAFVRGRRSSGSGFVVRSSIVATNKHVIAGELIEDIEVHFPSASAEAKGPYKVKLLYEDPRIDLSFLSVSTDLPPLKLDQQHRFRRGQDILVIGNPGKLQNAVSRGVMSTQATIGKLDYYQLGISINPGNSGGPVLNMTGDVIGIATLKSVVQEGVAYCIPLPQIEHALSRLDGLTSQEIDTANSQHRLRFSVQQVSHAGEFYKTGMQIYSVAIRDAVVAGGNANDAVAVTRNIVENFLAEFDQLAMDDLAVELPKISSDSRVPQETRQRLADLWVNYLELKSYVENPRGKVTGYFDKCEELSDNHDRLSNSLKLLTGLEIEEE